MNEGQDRMGEERKVIESVHPSDSVSVAASTKSRKSNSSCTYSSASSAPSARLKMEMERAALLAQAVGMKQKYAFEEKDDNPKAEKEELEINTTLAAADTKLEILQKYERSNVAQSDGAYSEQHENQPLVLRECHGEPASYIASQHENTNQHFSVSPFS